jgi:hypothetical protein
MVVVVALLGVFLLVPLVLAWVSTNPRRWSRVERVLGREPSRERPVRWVAATWMGLGAVYLALGIVQARTPRQDGPPWLSLLLGATWMLNGSVQLFLYLRNRKRETRTG